MNYSGDGKFAQYTTGIQNAYGNNPPQRSFLQKSEKRHKGFVTTGINAGEKVYQYHNTFENKGAKPYGKVYFTQPIGAEFLYSDKLKRYQICHWFGGIPNCEKHLPKRIGRKGPQTVKYYGARVEDC